MKASKRYYLHSKVKKAGFEVDGHGKTVYVSFGEEGGHYRTLTFYSYRK